MMCIRPLILAALILAPLATAWAEDADAEAAADARRAIDATLAAYDPEDPESAERVLVVLKQRGRRHVDALLAASVDRRQDADEQAVIEQAVRALGTKRLHDHLRAGFTGPQADQARVHALRVLARLGDARELDLALEIVKGVDGTWLRVRRVAAAWEAAWGRVTARGVSRLELGRALADVPEGVRTRSARVLVDRRDADALGAVVHAVRAAPEDAGEILAELRRASPLLLDRAEARQAVIAGLEADAPASRRAAAALAGRMRLREAFPLLVDAIDAPDPTLGRSALQALRALTGRAVGRDAAAWRRWADAEEAWAAGLDLRELETTADLARAIQEIVARPFAGAAFAPDLAKLLVHEDPRLAAVAAAALGRLGRLDVAPELARAVGDADPAVATAAHAALVQLTGKNLDASAKAWERALDA